jgi:hypothetical protein
MEEFCGHCATYVTSTHAENIYRTVCTAPMSLRFCFLNSAFSKLGKMQKSLYFYLNFSTQQKKFTMNPPYRSPNLRVCI